VPHTIRPRLRAAAVALSALVLGLGGAVIPAATQAASGPLVIAYPGGPRTLNSWLAYDLTSDAMILNVYDQLITYAQVKVGGQVQGTLNAFSPMLAKRWTSNAQKTVYTFFLRNNAEFSNGDPLTAADVVWTYQNGMKANGNLSFLASEAAIKSVAEVNPYEVRITLAHPDPMFLPIIAMYPFSILDSKVAAKEPAAYWNTHELGSGPYELQSLQPASQAVFVLNPHYWGPRPAYSQVILKFITSPSVRQQLVEGGSVQVALNMSPLALQTMAKNPAVTEHTNLSETVVYFGMNEADPPFNNKLVRQALSYAVPYSSLISQVMYGQAAPMDSPVPIGMPTHTGAGWNYSYDLAKAKALLARAGYPHGFTFTFTLDPANADWVQDATLLQASFAKIGVTMKITQVADAEFQTLLAAKKMQAFISSWDSFVNDPGYHLGFLFGKGMQTNATNYTNPVVDSLLPKAEFDANAAQRNADYATIQKTINQDAAWLDLYQYKWTVVTYHGVSGYVFYPDTLLRFWAFK
jgi:peptide/nickel transport system substrate-binding protein